MVRSDRDSTRGRRVSLSRALAIAASLAAVATAACNALVGLDAFDKIDCAKNCPFDDGEGGTGGDGGDGGDGSVPDRDAGDSAVDAPRDVANDNQVTIPDPPGASPAS